MSWSCSSVSESSPRYSNRKIFCFGNNFLFFTILFFTVNKCFPTFYHFLLMPIRAAGDHLLFFAEILTNWFQDIKVNKILLSFLQIFVSKLSERAANYVFLIVVRGNMYFTRFVSNQSKHGSQPCKLVGEQRYFNIVALSSVKMLITDRISVRGCIAFVHYSLSI